jgi:hypothetical protein
MSNQSVTNETGVRTPDEQKVLARLRQLPADAIPHLLDFMDLLETRAANPGSPDASTPGKVAEMFVGEAFGRVLRALPPATAELILEFATHTAGGKLAWSYDDPESLERSADLMGLDPFVKRASDAITRDFECTLGDGLKDLGPYE